MLQGVSAPSKVYRKHEGPVHCLAQGLFGLGIIFVTIDETHAVEIATRQDDLATSNRMCEVCFFDES